MSISLRSQYATWIACVLFIVCASTVGCATSGAIPIGDAAYPATDPAKVRVFLRRTDVKRPFDEIGYVTAEKTAGWTFTNVAEDKVVRVLIEEAAKIGADAIILDSVSEDSVPWAVKGAGGSSSLNRKSGRALAIKFKSQGNGSN